MVYCVTVVQACTAADGLRFPRQSDTPRRPAPEHDARPRGIAVNSLELKIPPPAVAVLICAAMWGLSLFPPVVVLPTLTRAVVALAIAAVGGIFSMAGGIHFRRAKTTVNPMKPQAASSLVTGGIYKFTRNPMYVGLLLVLIGWAAFLCSLWALLLGPIAFVLYISRFQILPEERVLSSLFGAEFTAYQSRVRRWL